jgi:VTC domain.
MRSQVIQLLNEMYPISLEDMDAVRLMDRVDTKYVIHSDHFESFIHKIKEDYYVQEINGMRVSDYLTTYLDTPSEDMFIAHQNGKSDREKIRIREYVDSQIVFLEVKHKSNKGKTQKVRIAIKDRDDFRNKENSSFLNRNSQYELKNLFPRLENEFNRITLVNKGMTERLTLDCDINFRNLETGKCAKVSDLVIVEIKQNSESYSPAREVLSVKRVRPVSISKYCLGAIITNPSLKYNRFKKKLMLLNKLTNNHYGHFIGMH